jgi:hypothetical protein
MRFITCTAASRSQPHVHVKPERELLVSQLLVVVDDPLVMLPGGDRLILPARERVSAGGDGPVALLLRRLGDFAPQPQKLGAHVEERAQHRSHGLDLRSQQLARHPLPLTHDLP